ncbi:hypothetical protein VBD025_00835 [Virgibacillus flavescens]|uniref:hypothetical protein n=1 Tax=Virgibacillus flavescens TaxID=1611422 RepID=UPI003D348A3C
MLIMNDKQKAEFNDLQQKILGAVSRSEVKFYSDEIHLLLKELESDNQSRFTPEQDSQYEDYMEKMLAAHDSNETRYYENKIMHLIDEADRTRKGHITSIEELLKKVQKFTKEIECELTSLQSIHTGDEKGLKHLEQYLKTLQELNNTFCGKAAQRKT